LKEVEEAFKEASMSLQQHEKLYFTDEEWDTRRKKHKAENHSGSGARGGGVGKGRGCIGSSSSGPSSKPTGECRSKSKKEQVHIVQDEDEASLMLTTAILIHPEAR
jgi:hypothetical protein